MRVNHQTKRHRMLEVITVAAAVAVIAYVYAEILIKPDHLLGEFWQVITNIFTSTKEIKTELPQEIQEATGEKYSIDLIKVESKILKPLGGCVLCVSGQLSFWYMIYISFQKNTLNLLEIIITICLTITLTKLLTKILK